MGDRLRMTLCTGRRSFCLAYADRELMVLMGLRGARDWLPEGERFVVASGVFANFSVARGQNTTAWFKASRTQLLQAAEGVLSAARRETVQLRRRKAAWAEKMPALVAFLRASRARHIAVRHHYAWN